MKPKEKAIAYFMNNIEGYDIIKNNHIIGEMVDVALEEQARQIFGDLESYEGGQFSFIIGEKDGKDVIQEYKNKWVKTK